jgi:hypothetical protein
MLFGERASAAEDIEAERNTVSLLFENDVFYRSDRDYTNGVGLAYTTAPANTPRLVVNAARALPFLLGPGEVRASFELGQEIFTPTDTVARIPPETERPYAGYLWTGVGILTRDERRLDQLQLQLGVVGPASLARNAQIFIHAIIGQDTPEGWDYQLRNEPAFQLHFERAYKVPTGQRLLRFSFDVQPHFGAALGNVHIYANGGAMARFGLNLPDDYGPPRLQPSLPGSNFFEPPDVFSAYVFAGVDGRAVARNIFLDGNTFMQSRHVHKHPFFGDLQFGFVIATRVWRLSFSHVYRSREYKTQDKSTEFGSLNFTLRL